MDEDDDRVSPTLVDADRSRTFSPSQRPSFQPWTRANTTTTTAASGASVGTGFQRTSSAEPLLRRQRSRQFSRTSVDTDSILLDRPTRKNTASGNGEDNDDGTEQWHSIALIFVALPAFAGMFFENGSAVVTDILMLGLGCLFLYWSVKWPWQWYYSTQEMKLAELDPSGEFAVIDEESDDDHHQDHHTHQSKSASNDTDEAATTKDNSDPPSSKPRRTRRRTEADLKRQTALTALQSLEIMALTSCFLSPGAVAYMLHSIRPYLSRPSGGVVSNSNLTLFVLAAELRPVLHFFRLVEERTLHLQRIVSSLPASEERQLEERVTDLLTRLEAIESSSSSSNKGGSGTGLAAAEKADFSPTTISSLSEIEKPLLAKLQPQLDALNRAVRRYEKRATTQAIVTEARLQDLEARLKDALSLAAAASRQVSQSGSGIGGKISGMVAQIAEVVRWVVTRPVEVALLPVRIAGEVWRWLVGPRKRRKGRSGGKGGGGGAVEGREWASEFKGRGGR